jgi:tight adherence protein C
MAILIAILVFAVLAGVISLIGYRMYARPGRLYEQLGAQGTASMTGEPAEERAVSTVIEQVGGLLPLDPEDASVLERDLVAAGFRNPNAVLTYLGLRLVGFVVIVALAVLLRGSITSNPILQIVIPVAAAFAGWFGPSFILEYLVNARHDRIRKGLPDVLDLMVICVEAGLGLDQALQHVARELMDVFPDVSYEIELVHLEIRGGKRRADALRSLAERTAEEELRKLVAVLIQADRFGTSVAESLRTHSDFMRMRRRQDAEERAAKVGVKLVFPIFFLILPSMLVCVAGPGMLQVFKYLFPLMRQFHPQ